MFINGTLSHPMLIKVKSLIGIERQFELPDTAGVLDLKRVIEQLEAISPEQQRLIYSGKILMDSSSSLSEYNIVDGSVVQMVIALRGG